VTPPAPLLELREVGFGYGGRAVVQRVCLAVRPGEFVIVRGANGSGKTTLLRGLLGLVPPLAGQVERRPGLRVGYVPQRETLDPLYPLSAFDVVRMGTWRDLPCWRIAGAGERRRTHAALADCRASDFARQRYASLSGGQRQRVLLARALASDPEWLVLDEPTAGVDPDAARGILDLLSALCRERGLAVWMVTHQLGAVAGRAARAFAVAEGRVRPEPPC